MKYKGIDEHQALLQYKKYLNEGFKDDLGLAECTILIRRHGDEKLNQLMNAWFYDFVHYIHRDQLSLLPCVSRLNFTGFKIINGSVWNNQFCIIGGHRSSA